MPATRFAVVARDTATAARTGVLRTPHGPIHTPAFAPVGTQGAVKAAAPRDLRALGVQVLMANAYHLAMRPGPETVQALGGLHALAGWDGPVMADSGGFQVFSLETRRRIDPEGVTFRSHVDGSEHRFTPESVVGLQEAFGADLIMPLDLCTPYPVERRQARADMELTHDWAARSLKALRRGDQLMYGIVQGSVFPELRAESARTVAGMGFDAFAVGGVSVGEGKSEMLAAIESAAPHLPEGAPRHLLGVGHPEDIVAAAAHGMDTFDCVMPTRVARNAGALTRDGRINLRNAEHARDPRPIEEGCACYACQRFSRGAVRHLFKAGEILGLQLLTLHNLHFLLELMRALRAAIGEGGYEDFRRQFLSTYAGGAYAASGSR